MKNRKDLNLFANGIIIHYHLDCEQKKEEFFLVISLELSEYGSKRIFYLDVLKQIAEKNDRKQIDFLIQEQIKFLNRAAMRSQIDTAPFNRIYISRQNALEAVILLVQTERLFWKNKKLSLSASSISLNFRIDQNALIGELQIEKQSKNITQCSLVFPSSPPWVIFEEKIYVFSHRMERKWLSLIYPQQQTFEIRKLERLLEDLKEEYPALIVKKESVIEQVWPFLVLKDRLGAFADLWMDYGNEKVAIHDLKGFYGRRPEKEKEWEKDLLETAFIRKDRENSHYFCPLDEVNQSLQFLLELGWKIVDLFGREVILQTDAHSHFSMENEQLLIQGKAYFGSDEISTSKLFDVFKRREHFVEISREKVGWLDHQWKELFQPLEEVTVMKECIAIKKSDFGLIDQFYKSGDSTEMMQQFQSIFSTRSQIGSRGQFLGTLYPYQQQGVEWLSHLYTNGFHGLLADQMGLGKTVQVLAFLAQVSFSKPILIVVPTSLIFNWRKEIHKFLPSIEVYEYVGNDRDLNEEIFKKFPLFLTSYAILRQDKDLLSKIAFECIILDEAQMIKNHRSQLAQAARQLKGTFRLAITGTPIENRIEDLFSIFLFLMPNLLPFLKIDPHSLSLLKRKIRPFILRRKKEIIAKELPPKIEQTVWIEMQNEQKEIYQQFLQMSRIRLRKSIQSEGMQAHRMDILETILRLRQICCHPLLVDPESQAQSAKLERLLEDLESILEEKGKVLIYSQFTQMLELIGRFLRERQYTYLYLDGQTKDREQVVKQFQEDENSSIFLISLRAGGVGLNLTVADYVFFIDPWWNEAVEQQAMDRAHRLGRIGSVIVKRYIMASSIEEKILALKQKKNVLSKEFLDFEHAADLDLSEVWNLINLS